MKATGIVRRMDELGRVVIPKEMRRTMHLKEGEELEIFAEEEGLFLKKYSAIAALGPLAEEYVRAITKLVGNVVYILDTDGVLAQAGAETLSEAALPTGVILTALAERKPKMLTDVSVVKGGTVHAHVLLCPILAHGDLFGAIVMGAPVAIDSRAQIVVQTACCLLEKHVGD